MSGSTNGMPKPAEKKKWGPVWTILLILLALVLLGAIIQERADNLARKAAAPVKAVVQSAPADESAGARSATSAATAPKEVPLPPVQPPAAEKPAVADWMGYANMATGYQIQYPPADPNSILNPEAGPVQLEPAIGGKERTMRIEIIKGIDKRADSRGCVDQRLAGPAESKFTTINGIDFCLVTYDEGAAGSTYRSYVYSTKHGQDLAVFTFVIRFPTSVRIIAGCEEDADQNKPACLEFAFDETRDAALFQHIMDTIVHN